MGIRVSPEEKQRRAHAQFEKSEQRAREGAKARDERDLKTKAQAAKTVRLRALRLAKEAADELAAKNLSAEKAVQATNSPNAARKKASSKAGIGS